MSRYQNSRGPAYPGRSEPERPSGVSVPDDISAERPSAAIPQNIAAFFGKNGIWWGQWKSPQVKGGYDAILVIQQIKSAFEARITYFVPDYPAWYIAASRWETLATFVTGPDGRLVLRVPYAPAATTMDFWLHQKQMKGIMYGRYMRSDITRRPLA